MMHVNVVSKIYNASAPGAVDAAAPGYTTF
eukprot:SAG31_NODE_32877_length_350_cov_1.442231_1_plen_29_part_10